MSPAGYSTMIEGKSKVSKVQLRLGLVRYARKEGIKEAARVFRCSRNTVRLWLRRYDNEGFNGLGDRSSAPKKITHKTSSYNERKVIKERMEVPCYGAGYLNDMFWVEALCRCHRAILRQNGLTRKLRRKYLKKRDLPVDPKKQLTPDYART